MELRGNLRDFGLPDIIQLVAFGRKTGVLRVDSESGGAALYFHDGSVVHADSPGLEGEPAVFSLFGIPDGEFRFQSDVSAPRRTISMDPTNLVMEAARLLDESRRAEEGDRLAGAGGMEENCVFEEPPPPRDRASVKRDIKELLTRRFGRGAKRLLQAVDQCGDSDEQFLGLAERVEKYVHVFLDNRASRTVADEIRSLVSGP